MQLAAPNAPTDADVTAHCAALEDPDIVGDLDVAADTLHSHRTLRVTYGDVARDVAHTKTRHALHDERLVDGLVVALTGILVHPHERRAHRTGDLVRIDVDVHVEAVLSEPERVALFVPGAALFASMFALALAVSSLAVSHELPLRAVALALLLIAPALLVLRIERHDAGSRSKSEAASSGAIRPSASSRRISLRRSASRSGSACEGNPSARITASRRERTVG